jgi:hypothetical protein
LARWIQRLFRRQRQDPRDVLRAGHDRFRQFRLASRAVAFYGAGTRSSSHQGTDWFTLSRNASNCCGSSAERAFEIFFNLLSENNYIGYVDWDAGGDQVLEAYDRLFLRAGLARFTDAEREEAARICTRCKERGDPLLMLFDHLETAVKTRGREIVRIHLGQADQ